MLKFVDYLKAVLEENDLGHLINEGDEFEFIVLLNNRFYTILGDLSIVTHGEDVEYLVSGWDTYDMFYTSDDVYGTIEMFFDKYHSRRVSKKHFIDEFN